MKKTKILITIIVAFIVMIMGSVFAYTGELDPDNLISYPIVVWNGEGKVTIKSSVTNYTLYYQGMELTNYSEIKAYEDSDSEKLKSEKEDVKTKQKAYNDAYDVWKEKRTAYENASDTEKDAAQQEMNAAYIDYQEKTEIYEAAAEAYNAHVKEHNDTIKGMVSIYNDSEWIETTDGSFKIDRTTYTGTKAFALWTKLVTSAGDTVYDFQIYSVDGTKKESSSDNKGESSEKSKSGESTNTSEEGKKDDTVADKDIPQTGENIALIGGIVLIAVGAVVLVMKNKEYKQY